MSIYQIIFWVIFGPGVVVFLIGMRYLMIYSLEDRCVKKQLDWCFKWSMRFSATSIVYLLTIKTIAHFTGITI